ncbi:MAG: type II/IV secretion system ATPase subunit [Candidatus Heimdallarchaeota archaeon]|nr:type II/IV secretion system ATPase subunit [Candidatus Heimdallarchaeota archaeon]MCK5048131.1 type II/IV secretion system ATPase subunit [Candidatus Heimdallarchaeota archaeon]
MPDESPSMPEIGIDDDDDLDLGFDASTMPVLEETYPLIPPHSYALIQTDPVSKRTSYLVMESPLNTDEEEKYNMITDILIDELDVDFSTLTDKAKAEEFLRRKVDEIIRIYKIKMEASSFDKVMYYIMRDLIGFGKIEPLFRDPQVEDLSCDGVGIPLYIWHRSYESIASNVAFDNHDELDSFVIKLAQRSGRHLSISQPLLDASLPDGSRLQLSYGREVTQKGSTFTIRRFRADPWTIIDLLIFNSLSVEMAAWYWFLIENRMSLLVAGGTAAGKTSLLNSLCMFIKPDLKVVSIEDTAELNIGHENWISSVTRSGFGTADVRGRRRGEIDMYDLLRAAMRQRPDYILVGEIRGSEAYTMFQAMSTGHSGAGTIHGDDVTGVIHRLENEPMKVPRTMVRVLDVVHVQRKVRVAGKFERRATEVVEIVDFDPVTKELLTNRVFGWSPQKDTYTYFGRSYMIEKIKTITDLTDQDCWNEIRRRETILRWMVRRQIRHFRDVSATIREYYANPERMYERARRSLG